MNHKTFAKILLAWSETNTRILPWKIDKNPYKIWISEIILQQTRVAQGTPYFIKFIETFPDIYTLAHAHEDEVMSAWQGLGYYSRARNLHATAKILWEKYHGVFPENYEVILQLKGIGTYTASAIMSFAFDQSYPVVDANVIRIISRILGISEPTDTTKTKNQIQSFVEIAIKKTNPSVFNQAIMDFGAVVCLPTSPKCIDCPLATYCVAYQKGAVDAIPVKAKKAERKKRFFHYFECVFPNEKIMLTQRMNNDIWKKLYEFPQVETNDMTLSLNDAKKSMLSSYGIQINGKLQNIVTLHQVLSHRNIVGVFYRVHIHSSQNEINSPYCLVDRQKVSNFAFPKIITTYLEKHSYFSL